MRGLRRIFFYGVRVLADRDNQRLIRGALNLMREEAPHFFRLVTDNVAEVRQSEGPFTMGPARSVRGTDRIEFRDFSERYGTYNVAGFLVHEATHMHDQHKGLTYTKGAEIRARQAEIALFRALGRAEGRSFQEIIRFIEHEITMIKDGNLYPELPR